MDTHHGAVQPGQLDNYLKGRQLHIVKAYGFNDIDIEDAIAPREW